MQEQSASGIMKQYHGTILSQRIAAGFAGRYDKALHCESQISTGSCHEFPQNLYNMRSNQTGSLREHGRSSKTIYDSKIRQTSC